MKKTYIAPKTKSYNVRSIEMIALSGPNDKEGYGENELL